MPVTVNRQDSEVPSTPRMYPLQSMLAKNSTSYLGTENEGALMVLAIQEQDEKSQLTLNDDNRTTSQREIMQYLSQ